VKRAWRALAALAAAALAAHAQVYKWVDSNGKTQYGDRPPEEAKSRPLRIDTPSGAVGLADSNVEVPETEMTWFRVGGLTLRELNASKEANGPFNDIVAARVWGQTGWRIRWKFAHDLSKGDCRIGTFTVTVASRMWLPKWEEYNLATPEVRGKWDAFYKGLVVHENGHKANGIKAGNDLARRLRGMKPYADCARLNDDITQIGTRIMSEYDLVDRAFDRVERIYREGLR
jgi:predicted secreted Zn-dependent protease